MLNCNDEIMAVMIEMLLTVNVVTDSDCRKVFGTTRKVVYLEGKLEEKLH